MKRTHARACLWLLIGLCGLAWLPSTPLWAQTQTGESCHVCHQQQVNGGLSQRAHGALAHSCSHCHGASAAHASAPMQTRPTIRFGADDGGDTGTTACLACHREQAAHWAFSAHAGTGCTACHTIHTSTDPVQQDALEFQVCTGCHERERAEQIRFSRHPLQEGHLQCSDCHAPHGGAAMNGLTAASVNEVCYQCHAATRGPFLFEHEPVQEDCSHCHLPHASMHDHLLKAREPMLCQQCHIAARHPGRAYDATQLSLRDINIIGQACTNCHSQVHGGNQPQSATFRR